MYKIQGGALNSGIEDPQEPTTVTTRHKKWKQGPKQDETRMFP